MNRKFLLLFLTVILAGTGLVFSVQSIQAVTIDFSYDDTGRLVLADYGAGKRISYTYDANGNLLMNRFVGEIERGDVNIDGEVNLLDALVTLRLLSGFTIDSYKEMADYRASEKSVEDRVGFPEALWILQRIAGLR